MPPKPGIHALPIWTQRQQKPSWPWTQPKEQRKEGGRRRGEGLPVTALWNARARAGWHFPAEHSWLTRPSPEQRLNKKEAQIFDWCCQSWEQPHKDKEAGRLKRCSVTWTQETERRSRAGDPVPQEAWESCWTVFECVPRGSARRAARKELRTAADTWRSRFPFSRFLLFFLSKDNRRRWLQSLYFWLSFIEEAKEQ